MRVRSIPVNKRESNEEVARIPLPKAGEFLPLIFCSLKKERLFYLEKCGILGTVRRRYSFMAEQEIFLIHTKWIVVVSICLTIVGLLGFSFAGQYWMLFLFAVPYGLGAGSVDAALNHYVANNYPSSVMNFLHCFYGLGAIISPNLMALALKYAHWNEGYRWTAYVQIGILAVCILSLPLWKNAGNEASQETEGTAGIREAVRVPGVILTLTAFFSYCAGETTSFLWTSSYFAGTKQGMSDGLIASFGSLVFGGLQQTFGIWIMPLYLAVFAFLNLILLEIAYRRIDKADRGCE